MTGTPSHGMTAERLEEIRAQTEKALLGERIVGWGGSQIAIDHAETKLTLLTHIDAQAAEIERLTRERDFIQAQANGERKNIAGWIAARDAQLARAEAAEAKLAPVGDGEVQEAINWLREQCANGNNCGFCLPCAHATLIHRLDSSLARARAVLEAAAKQFEFYAGKHKRKAKTYRDELGGAQSLNALEADTKGRENLKMAAMCREALARAAIGQNTGGTAQ